MACHLQECGGWSSFGCGKVEGNPVVWVIVTVELGCSFFLGCSAMVGLSSALQ
jgi:hypothetical protein